MESHIQYLGARPLSKMMAGPSILQEPLLDLYLPYITPGRSIALERCQLTINMAGLELLFRSPNNPATREQSCSVTSFTLWYAMKYVTTRQDADNPKKSKKQILRGGFQPLQTLGIPAFATGGGDKLLTPINKVHHFLEKCSHPALFVIVLRRKSGLHVLDLHAFICPSEKVALDLVQAVSEAHATFSAAQSNTLFEYSPFRSPATVVSGNMGDLADGRRQQLVSGNKNNDQQQRQPSVRSHHAPLPDVVLHDKRTPTPSQTGGHTDKGLQVPSKQSNDQKLHNRSKTPENAFIPDPIRQQKNIVKQHEFGSVRNLREVQKLAKENEVSKDINIQKRDNNRVITGAKQGSEFSPGRVQSQRHHPGHSPQGNKPTNPNASRVTQSPPSNSGDHTLPRYYFSPTHEGPSTKLGQGYSLLSTGNGPPSGDRSAGSQPLPPQPSPVYAVPQKRVNNRPSEHGNNDIVSGNKSSRTGAEENARKAPDTQAMPRQAGPPHMFGQRHDPTPVSIKDIHVHSPPGGERLLKELRAFQAYNKVSDDSEVQRYTKIQSQETASERYTEMASDRYQSGDSFGSDPPSASRPVARVRGVRVLPSNDKPSKARPKSEYFDRTSEVNWQMEKQSSQAQPAARDATNGHNIAGVDEKLLLSRKKDAEIAEALAQMRISTAGEPYTLAPGATRGLNFEKSLGYFP